MKFSLTLGYVLVSLLFLVFGCSNGVKTGSNSQLSAFNQVYKKLVESSPEFGTEKKSFFALSQNAYEKAAFSSWNNSTTTFWNIDGKNLNPKNYVGYMLDKENKNSILERAKMPFLISCSLDILAQKTENFFSEGTYEIVFTNNLLDVCGKASDFIIGSSQSMIGEKITVLVSNLTSSNYDQLVYLPNSSNTLFDNDQWMYIKNNDSILNFMHIEGDSTNFSVTSISFNKNADSGFFQYVKKNGTYESSLFRIFMDPSLDMVRIFAYVTYPINSNAMNYFTVTSTFLNQTQAALSMSYENIPAPYSSDLVDGNICISTADGSQVVSDTLTCTAISQTTLASSGAVGLISELGIIFSSNIINDAGSGALADNLPTFDESTILSASIGL